MTDVLTQDLVSYDPLSEVTRKERRALLGLSLLGVALVKVPLIPEKFTTFGIEFSRVNQKAFLILYALVVVYFLVAFALYAFTDCVAWVRSERIRYREYLRQDELTRQSLGKGNEDIESALKGEGRIYGGLASYGVAKFASRARGLFEFVVPIAFAAYSIYVIVSYAALATVA
jgi:hypothetical protein